MRLLTAGESHGPELTVVIDGVPAGLEIDADEIDLHLRRRQGGFGRGARSTRIEQDTALITGGLADVRKRQSVTTGAPVSMRIVNRDFDNQPPVAKRLSAPRPGHADMAGGIKYGINDFRLIRERASARETASRVAAGAIARSLLAAFDVRIGSFVTSIGDVDAGIDLQHCGDDHLLELSDIAEGDPVRTASRSREMCAAIEAARIDRQTLGGTFVVWASGLPVGLGSHVQWDRRLDGILMQAIGSIPAIKGVEIGDAFDSARKAGVNALDEFADHGLQRSSNHAGGIEGGMTNGAPILIRAAMKPLSSVRADIRSVDVDTGEPANPGYVRSDICAVPAAAVVGEAMLALTLANAITERFGADRIDAMLAARDAVAASHFERVP